MRNLLPILLWCQLALGGSAWNFTGHGGGGGGGTTPAAPTITLPATRQIFQRDGSGNGVINVAGTTASAYTSVEAATTVITGGAPVAWTTIQGSFTGSSFSGSFTASAGWYNVLVRLVNSGTVGPSTTVSKIGVGELFIVAGQSLVANLGSSLNTVTDDRISAVDLGGVWQLANDPQPVASGSGGSPIPAIANSLIATLNVPIGFCDVSVNGTSTAQWLATYYTANLVPALDQFNKVNFRAILWEQGQTDGANGIPAVTYEANMATLISNSRSYAGWTIPWGVADTSTIASNSPYPIIQTAQAFVVANNSAVFAGSNSDSISNANRWDGTHFNAAGQLLQGGMWATAIRTYFSW